MSTGSPSERGNSRHEDGVWTVRAQVRGRWKEISAETHVRWVGEAFGSDLVALSENISRGHSYGVVRSLASYLKDDPGDYLPGWGPVFSERYPFESREYEAKDMFPGMQPIDAWNKQALQRVSSMLPLSQRLVLGNGGELKWKDDALDVESVAWQDLTTVIFAVERDWQAVEVRYVPGDRDDERSAMIRAAHTAGRSQRTLPTLGTRPDSSFEWKGFFGTNTAVIDGSVRLRNRSHIPGRGSRERSARFTLDGLPGLILGSVVNRLGKRVHRPSRDPSCEARLQTYEECRSDAASRTPRLDSVSPASITRCIVLVHGTFGCAVPIAHELLGCIGLAAPSVPIYRFEHDTFQNLNANADHLKADLEKALEAPSKVLFVAHSRGGLVATLAAGLLGDGVETRVVSAGAPFLGTPLVNAGAEALRLLGSFGLVGSSFLAKPDLATSAIRALLRARHLPFGVEAMIPGGDALAQVQRVLGDAADRWGANFMGETAYETGYGIALAKRGFARKAFNGEANDLIVPTESAVCGGGQIVDGSCGHSDYFGRKDFLKHLATVANIMFIQ